MKIGDLNEDCGICQLFYYCAHPSDEMCLCTNPKLSEMTVEQYLVKVDTIRKNQKKKWSNKTIEKMITCDT